MKKLLTFLFTLLALGVFAQDESLADLFKVNYETPLTIELESEEELEAPVEPITKKKKEKPKVFFGIKTKRGFTRTGFGKNVVVELFHYLKHYEEPAPYMRNFYWYNFKKRKIINSLKVDKKNAGVLHGHYVKKLGDQVLEEGYYYKGVKHKRWVRLNRHDILQDKAVYWKGWPQQSLLAFYDFQRNQLKEVIPVHFGERDGTYYAFHSNGKLAVRGKYKFDHKVGLWREYYSNRRIKREVVYPEDPFDFNFEPYITKEWSEKGILIYDHGKYISSIK
ncbi:MAG: hypothetical protein KI790_04620 [Cyclobacteriaceae bacterium]|nr:hypothetical protein [Cyclobacteriaceae bacterium HetDA_MAG_MS6]